MGTLYLVRHGQASFGAEDYDNLSPLGRQQAVRLGQYWRENGQAFDAVYRGTLRRHAQTLTGISQGLAWVLNGVQLAGLDEYDSHALIHCLHPEPLSKPDTPAKKSQHFRYLCDAMSQWMAGTIKPRGMPSWMEFYEGVGDALHQIRQQHVGQNVLLISSGGPISAAVAMVMGSDPGVVIGLNMRLHNSAVTEFSFSTKRHSLKTFNSLSHLTSSEFKDWITLI